MQAVYVDYEVGTYIDSLHSLLFHSAKEGGGKKEVIFVMVSFLWILVLLTLDSHCTYPLYRLCLLHVELLA